MAKRNNTSRKSKKELRQKTAPPVGLITMGVGIILIGIAALFLMPKSSDASASTNRTTGEYSSVPMKVDFAAPDISLENLEGKEESLKNYLGEVVMVNFWATWCPPCKAELPVLQKYYEDHVDEGFTIIGIDGGEPQEQVAAFIATTDVTYPIWLDLEGEGSRAFNANSYPSSFVIDRDGTIVLAWTGQISLEMLEKHVTPVIEK